MIFPDAGLGVGFRNPGVSIPQHPPLGLAGRVQRKRQADTIGADAAAGIAGRFRNIPPTAFGVSLRILSLGFLPEAATGSD